MQSSRRLERECQRNIELVWLTGRLMPDFKTIADFRKDNGEAIRKVCRESTCANRGDWAHEWTSSNLAAVSANAQASSISLVVSGPPEQCRSQQAASRGSDPG